MIPHGVSKSGDSALQHCYNECHHCVCLLTRTILKLLSIKFAASDAYIFAALTIISVAGEELTYGEYVLKYGLPGVVAPSLIFPDTPVGNAALCQFIAYNETMPGPTITAEQISAQGKVGLKAFASNQLSEAIHNITNPALIFHGDQDIILSVDNADYLYDNLRDIYVAYINEKAGHGLIFQEYADVTETINYFLDYVEGQYNYDDAAGS